MSSRYWVVIPAAGVGRRMSGATPKQYAPLAGRTVFDWSLVPFIARTDIAGIVVALAEDDSRFAALPAARDARVRTTTGGAERADSVLRGVEAVSAGQDANEGAKEDDWVLVHDAARPCLSAEDLSKLMTELADDDVGGLLATPVADTLKSAAGAQRVAATVSRQHLWRALTPQMFRIGLLRRALREANAARRPVTDESSAIEMLGLQPKLVLGRVDNIKITVPEDLAYAEFILRTRTSK